MDEISIGQKRKKVRHVLTLMSIIFFVPFHFMSCGKSEKPSKNHASGSDSLAIDTLQTSQTMKRNVFVPDWFKSRPQREGFYYAFGRANSSSKMIAREKAIMNAQIALAESLKIKADGKPALLRFSHITKEQALKKGKRWHYFVMMEMPKH